ncbi:MAG: helix-turn-helix domain-containing protein [Propionibacteriaceae bacterium]|jgi:excisionase family DNA binding protein|nr:helix-turn-helix domain-containing protein [Propionibacteriaceae bacterium]
MPNTAIRSHDKTYVPSEADIAKAGELFAQLEQEMAKTGKTVLMSASGQTYELPPTLFEVLRFVGATLAAGNGVTVVPRATKLTTQGAADFLGISRPTLVKLLERGDIPFEKVGRHRRVTLDDLLEYQERERARRRTVLSQEARNNQTSGMLALTLMPGVDEE